MGAWRFLSSCHGPPGTLTQPLVWESSDLWLLLIWMNMNEFVKRSVHDWSWREKCETEATSKVDKQSEWVYWRESNGKEGLDCTVRKCQNKERWRLFYRNPAFPPLKDVPGGRRGVGDMVDIYISMSIRVCHCPLRPRTSIHIITDVASKLYNCTSLYNHKLLWIHP